MTWPPEFDPIIIDPPYDRRYLVSAIPSDPDGYVAIPEPDRRTVIVRCVVCGRDDERRAAHIRFARDIERSDDGHAAATVRVEGQPRGGLWWDDGAVVGSCDVHTDAERVTALRLRGAEPFGFRTEPPA